MNWFTRRGTIASRISNEAVYRASRRTTGSIAVTLSILFGGAVTGPRASAAIPTQVTGFGSNPGQLSMFAVIPDHLTAPSPLVVVLHGCTQAAQTYATESGWLKLADTFGLVLVLAQTDSSPDNKCFRWFDSTQAARGQGQALSIKQMVDKVRTDHSIDPKRIYVTGLSAGGAMTSVMLAAYPEVFAGGGIVAGLPVGCAKTITEALQCMSAGRPSGSPIVGLPNGNSPMVGVPLPPGFCLFFPFFCPPPHPDGQPFTPSELGDFVRHASSSQGPFPIVSIWHGSKDATVSPINASEEMEQWTNVHGINQTPTVTDTVKGFPHSVFKDAAGRAVVETFSITGMDHGTPVDPGLAPEQCGTSDSFIINEHICSSLFIARFWGVASQ